MGAKATFYDKLLLQQPLKNGDYGAIDPNKLHH